MLRRVTAPGCAGSRMQGLIRGCAGYNTTYLPAEHQGEQSPKVIHDIDDLVVASDSWEEHLEHVQKVLERFRIAGLTLKVGK